MALTSVGDLYFFLKGDCILHYRRSRDVSNVDCKTFQTTKGHLTR